jgi:glycerophosphoryl diester phosphodiesterase
MSSPASAWPYPRWIAHRGAGKLAPENTLAAFRLGAAHGYRAFECDVKLSADEVPFLMHDATLERTTDGLGTAGDQPWSQLSQRDAGSWHGRAFAGEPLPTLAAIAAFILRNGYQLNLEIKPTPGVEQLTGRVVGEQVRRLWAGQAVAPLLSSFRPEALQGARDAAPELPRALLLDTLWPGWFDMARDLHCKAAVTHHRLMDRALIDQLHGNGLKALVYTVNDASDAQRLLALGIDGIITDAVDQFSPALG